MKILIIGGNGTIGKRITAHFEDEHEVIVAARSNGDEVVDIAEEDYYIGIKSKLMGQVNLVRIGQNYLNPKGSITLSTGILADDPVMKTASAAMVNGGIHSFARAAALELDNGHRLNVVSLGMVEDAYDKYKGYFPGHNPIATPKVIKAYERSILGKDTGRIIRYYE